MKLFPTPDQYLRFGVGYELDKRYEDEINTISYETLQESSVTINYMDIFIQMYLVLGDKLRIIYC